MEDNLSQDDYYYGVYVPYIERTDPKIEITQIIISVFSMLITGSVVFILIYRYNQLVIGKPFTHYVLMIAFSDTFVAFGYSFGYPSGIACNIQAFVNIFFTRFSWMWTVILVANLTSFVIRRKFICTIFTSHYILWPVNIFLQFIIFSNGSSYGNYTPGYDTCNFNNEKDVLNSVIWSRYVSDLILQICLGLIFLCSLVTLGYSLYLKYLDSYIARVVPLISEAWSTIILYPVSMILTYLPAEIYAFISSSIIINTGHEPNHQVIISNSLNLLIPFYGILLALIFYYKNEEARLEYSKIFRNLFMLNNNRSVEDVQDPEKRPSSIIELESTTNTMTNDVRRITIHD